jgi:hypothetical protein
MKELALPHNDWFIPSQSEALQGIIGRFKLKEGTDLSDPRTAATVMFHRASEPEHLARCVRESLVEGVKLAVQPTPSNGDLYDKSILRAVFAPLEMNFLSDTRGFKERLADGECIEIPSQFFVDERITGRQPPILVPVSVYRSALDRLDSTFAADETPGLIETQHAFLVPTRSFADERVIDQLMAKRRIGRDLLAAILSVDWTTPLYSTERLELMQYVPDKFSGAEDLRHNIIENIRSVLPGKRSSAAKQLLSNLAREHNVENIRGQAMRLLATCRSNASSEKHVVSWLELAAQRRIEIQDAQTSKNQRGTILEGGLGAGGFRRIFPQYRKISPKPHALMLDPSTGLAVPRRG